MVADDKIDDKIGSKIIVIILLAAAPAAAVGYGFSGTYLDLSYFRKSDDETAIIEFQYVSYFAYIVIIVAPVLIFVFYVLPWENILPQVSGDWLTLWFLIAVITPLLVLAYVSLVTIRPRDPRNEFGFHFARKSMIVLEGMLREDRKDEVKKIRFLMMALKWYNKFIKKNLKLEFDSAKICSSILSRVDKKETLDELVRCFEIDYNHKLDPNEMELVKTQDPRVYRLLKERPDKLDPIIPVRIKPINDLLKPINCLSKIANLPASESFLIQKKLITNLKEMVPIAVAIITGIAGVIAVLQVILPISK